MCISASSNLRCSLVMGPKVDVPLSSMLTHAQCTNPHDDCSMTCAPMVSSLLPVYSRTADRMTPCTSITPAGIQAHPVLAMRTYQYLTSAFCFLGSLSSASPHRRFHARPVLINRHQRSISSRVNSKGEMGSIGALYMCTNVDFTGECSYVKPNMGSCY